jgi:mannose-6-phosphate isomerase-like protein (cupin superfamily)
MPSRSIDFVDPFGRGSNFAWQHPKGAPEGVEELVLYRDADGSHSRFLRAAPGTVIPPNDTPLTHEFVEEVFVIGGRVTDVSRDVEVRPGMYACHMPGHEHGPLDCHGGFLTFEVRYYVDT